jgi:hypothetical protein
MHLSLDKDFSPTFPYSKTLVNKLSFAGPIVDSKWILKNDSDGQYLFETPVKTLTKPETLKILSQLHQNIYDKALNFNSKILTVLAISPLLFE